MARPQSIQAHNHVLDAALKLFSERGIDSTSMDAIAETSGVSKATIYKHWADKDALCLEVLARLHGVHAPPVVSDDVRSDIVALLNHRFLKKKSESQTRMMPHLMAYAARNPAFGMAWRKLATDPPRNQLTQLLKRAIAEGQLPAGLDTELSVALLIGPLLYRHILSPTKAEIPADMSLRVVEAFWEAHAVRNPKPARRSPPSGR